MDDSCGVHVRLNLNLDSMACFSSVIHSGDPFQRTTNNADATLSPKVSNESRDDSSHKVVLLCRSPAVLKNAKIISMTVEVQLHGLFLWPSKRNC